MMALFLGYNLNRGNDLTVDELTIDELKRLKDLCLIYEQDYYKYLMLKGKENGKIN